MALAPAIIVLVNGAGAVWLPCDSAIPGGLESRVTSTCLGSSLIAGVADDIPRPSVAVSWIVRCEGCSCAGAAKLPAVPLG